MPLQGNKKEHEEFLHVKNSCIIFFSIYENLILEAKKKSSKEKTEAFFFFFTTYVIYMHWLSYNTSIYVCVCVSHSVVSDSLQLHGL